MFSDFYVSRFLRFFVTVKNFISLIKFSHTVFAMPFAMIGFFWAWRDSKPDTFPAALLLKILLCMVFARNAAMAFNRYADRRFDGKNPRTANREIPAGKISPETALVFTAVNSILFCITTLFINRLTFGLSFAALAVILGYSYTKRFTALCHFILGLGLAIAPTGAYIAMTGAFSALPVLLSVLVLFWVGGFDILYALSDSVFDRKNRLRSIPAMLGNGNAMILSAVAHLSVAVTVIAIGLNFSRGILYWSGSFIFIFMMIYQQIIVWKKKDIGSYFGLINGISSICYGFFTILDLI